MRSLAFAHPEPQRPRSRIWPVFIPFAGCPGRCVFCAQHIQTGCAQTGLDRVLETVEADLTRAHELGRGPYELAFFGGTFTALPEGYPERFLALSDTFRKLGLITKTRCSTRPDRVTIPMLKELGARGLHMVELGVQSFDTTALDVSGRGYTADQVHRACDAVRAAGMELGIQLMPGLPGDHDDVFRQDVRETCAIGPDNTRLYPCLVLRGTELEQWWREGRYAPWDLERTRIELTCGVGELWAAGVPVIRMGVAPEEKLQPEIVAGPWHPALGQSVRARVLLEHVKARIAELGRAPRRLEVPFRHSGEIFGHARELVDEYARIGLDRESIRMVDRKRFSLC
ncbi:elongator complex protein 3 [Pseudodesulfovibrio senegalensis]|uniref:Radical SAM protein n=1 Tax=Pseudodesulfovibrio senegalensis TaxID=1721087 RepID=A0A6N6N0M5_9BACT|nr:radical SAM protein [Pseudodesulfovibrio senegalensis]KAB1440816.1 radical SAM protein [Pseudodesulfovibrio senegalensis]